MRPICNTSPQPRSQPKKRPFFLCIKINLPKKSYHKIPNPKESSDRKFQTPKKAFAPPRQYPSCSPLPCPHLEQGGRNLEGRICYNSIAPFPSLQNCQRWSELSVLTGYQQYYFAKIWKTIEVVLTYWGISKTFSLVCNGKCCCCIDFIFFYKPDSIFQAHYISRILRKVYGEKLTPWTRVYRHFLRIWHVYLW